MQKKIAASLPILAFLYGCVPPDIVAKAGPERIQYTEERDAAFTAALQSVAEAGLTVTMNDRQSGLIQTDWRTTYSINLGGGAAAIRRAMFVVTVADQWVSVTPKSEMCQGTPVNSSNTGCRPLDNLDATAQSFVSQIAQGIRAKIQSAKATAAAPAPAQTPLVFSSATLTANATVQNIGQALTGLGYVVKPANAESGIVSTEWREFGLGGDKPVRIRESVQCILSPNKIELQYAAECEATSSDSQTPVWKPCIKENEAATKLITANREKVKNAVGAVVGKS